MRGIKIFFTLFITTVALNGCSSPFFTLGNLSGYGITELENAKDKGISETFGIKYDTAFDLALKAAGDNKLVVFQKNREKRYIVLMGLPKQINTTEVGIFFETVSDSETKVTISSLSSSAGRKASDMIFPALRNSGQ